MRTRPGCNPPGRPIAHRVSKVRSVINASTAGVRCILRTQARHSADYRFMPRCTVAKLMFRHARCLRWRFILLFVLMRSTGVFATEPADVEFTPEELRRILRFSPLGSLPADETNRVADVPDAARFGQALFFDKRLSSDGSVSCATCHIATQFFVDGREIARGIADGVRNTPTLVNIGFHRWLFWDGRADTLWSQALQPIETPHEMNSTRVAAVALVVTDKGLRHRYETVFGPLPEPAWVHALDRTARPGSADARAAAAWEVISPADRERINTIFSNLGKAIAAYQRRLIGRGAPFDRFVEGLRTGNREKRDAISSQAQRGLKLFIGAAGCRNCHFGPLFSSGEFHDTGVPPKDGSIRREPGRFDGVRRLRSDPFNAAGRFSDDPEGPIAERTQAASAPPESWGQFKVPSLRNVAKTAPYMHAGQFATLREVVKFYSTREGALPAGHHPQETILQPLNLTDEQMDELVAFLETLTDETIGEPDLLTPLN